jgi:hypothetical protein
MPGGATARQARCRDDGPIDVGNKAAGPPSLRAHVEGIFLLLRLFFTGSGHDYGQPQTCRVNAVASLQELLYGLRRCLRRLPGVERSPDF